MGYHALLSPSSASRWVSCTASVAAQQPFPNTTSEASRPGTCGHQLAAEVLEFNTDPQSYLGRVMGFPPNNGNEDWADKFPPGTQFEHTVTVTQELIDACMAYVNFVRQRASQFDNVEVFIEQQVPIGHITGEPDARGTSDCGMIFPSIKLLDSTDLKLGRGKVYAYEEVEPAGYDVLTGEPTPPKLRMNLQLAMYLLGTYEKYGLLHDIERVRGTIVQPFLNHVSEYECSLQELLELGEWLKSRAEATRRDPEFKPDQKSCFFCKAKFTCHARHALNLEQCVEGFDDVEPAKSTLKPITVPTLGKLYGIVDMVRAWCDDIVEKIHAQLIAGETVIGPDGKPMKLVEGRKGSREWDDPASIEEELKRMRLKADDMYVKRLISPTEAEKLAPQQPKKRKGKKGVEEAPVEAPPSIIGKTQWSKLQEHIVQPSGKPTIALGSDPRPALQSASDMQEMPPADNSDLF